MTLIKMMVDPILIAGTTGVQDGAVVTALLDAGKPERTLVRDVRAPPAIMNDEPADAGTFLSMAGDGSVIDYQMMPRRLGNARQRKLHAISAMK